MRSDTLKKRIETLPHRALLMSSGVSAADLRGEKPFIGIANSYNNIIPGHIHLRDLASEVRRGIIDAGGVPFEWGVPGICDGIAMFAEMRLSLPSREHVAENIELMTLSHSLDGWVGITNCDKITPGMLMAAARLDLPAAILTGGPMKANIIDGKKRHPIEGFRIVGEVKAGRLSAEEAEALLPMLACGAGSCVGLYTANTMAVVTEVLGMSLPGCAATPALDPKKRQQAYETGRVAVELVKKGLRPRRIMTREAFENAVTTDMAMGGSTNAVLHIPAIAAEAGISIPVDLFDEISRRTPNICSIIPAGSFEMADLHRAGGVQAVLRRLAPMLKDSPTIAFGSIKASAQMADILDEEVIRPLDRPYHPEGGIAVLKGNLATSSVIKQTAVGSGMAAHSGPAKVFLSEEALMEALGGGRISEGDVVVLPFQGPAGAPGMPEMLSPTDAIKGAGFKRVALVTDGRFSGATTGPCVGHVEPEAYNKGPIAAVRDGDIIDIDIPARRINVRLSEEEIFARIAQSRPPERSLTPMLKAYRERFSRISR